MGVPVVSGADDWTLAQMARAWGGLPFVPANEATLEATLRRMVTSANMRAEAAAIGVAHVRRYHDERPALARLAELYAMAIKGYHAIRIPGKGGKAVTFRKTKGGRVYDIDGSVIEFPDGVLKTNDPIVIDRLRKLAKRSHLRHHRGGLMVTSTRITNPRTDPRYDPRYTSHRWKQTRLDRTGP